MYICAVFWRASGGHIGFRNSGGDCEPPGDFNIDRHFSPVFVSRALRAAFPGLSPLEADGSPLQISLLSSGSAARYQPAAGRAKPR